MCLLKQLVDCECPPALSFEELPIKPRMRTPLDQLGFPQKCCWCISLRPAVIIICILSFLWAMFELQSTDKFMATVFPSRGDVFFYCKMIYLLWTVCFMVACGVLLLGIIIKRYEPVNVYVWSAFIYCALHILLIIGSTVFVVLTSGSISNRNIMRIVLNIIWTCLFLYLIMIVNSYKLTLW